MLLTIHEYNRSGGNHSDRNGYSSGWLELFYSAIF
jgi:hypothetical protein